MSDSPPPAAALDAPLSPKTAALIRDIPDYPQPGILFKDITPVLGDGDALREVVEAMTARARAHRPDVIVGIESRGFLFGTPIAALLGCGFAPVRKKGKLPYDTIEESYTLEYGTNVVEAHVDAVRPGQRVVIVDDLLATGGTALAAANLVERLGGEVAGYLFFVELSFLNGRERLAGRDVAALVTF